MVVNKEAIAGFIKRERQIREAVKNRYAIIVKKPNGKLYFVFTSASSKYNCACWLERNLSHNNKPTHKFKVGSKVKPPTGCVCEDTNGRVETYRYWWVNQIKETPIEKMLDGTGWFTSSYCLPVVQEPKSGIDVTEDYYTNTDKRSTFTKTPQMAVRKEEEKVKASQELFKKFGF